STMKTHYLSTLPGGQVIAQSRNSWQGGENELPTESKSPELQGRLRSFAPGRLHRARNRAVDPTASCSNRIRDLSNLCGIPSPGICALARGYREIVGPFRINMQARISQRT